MKLYFGNAALQNVINIKEYNLVIDFKEVVPVRIVSEVRGRQAKALHPVHQRSSSSSISTHNANMKSCLPIGMATSHPEAPIGRRKLKLKKQRSALHQVSEFDGRRIVDNRDCGLSFRKVSSGVGRNEAIVMRICDLWAQEAEWSVRKSSIAWFTLDAEPQTSPSLMVRCKKRMWAAKWNEVVFTDESRICLQHHDGRIGVWRHRGERMLNICVLHRHTGPAPSIMVWGGIGYPTRTLLVLMTGSLNSQRYICKIELLSLPAGSPNLSPTEHMRSMVAEGLTQITPPDATSDQLWQRVEAAWSAVPQEHIQSLFELIPRRVAAVISNTPSTLATDSGRNHTSQKSINLII
ncbi:transposable element Tcb1 transposase [Trichonephila clavipes]|nr:transposable element Tcb1 transposase [Trichonephila clavipes]